MCVVTQRTDALSTIQSPVPSAITYITELTQYLSVKGKRGRRKGARKNL
ncbi:hypothetical protein FDUTEX481_07440 [Tolypothrix sp. PCC 7601]|nr:hypothetical protein FDUTEX481_07440 [Tolypothrix sp. PCC 7601]